MATLLIDADLSKRLSTELKRRGRDAVNAHELGIGRELDPNLLRSAAAFFDDRPWVLVTADDSMPATHAAVIAELEATVATLDGRWERHMDDQELYKWEVVQRWAHVMADQDAGTIRRYTPNSHRLWTPRRG